MNKAVPWSIKGVDFDARTAAKEAARRAGMTLGEWLNSVIADQAAENGIDPEEIGEDERVAAVRSRLERMSPAGASQQAGGLRRRSDRPGPPRVRAPEPDYETEYSGNEEYFDRPQHQTRRMRAPAYGREIPFAQPSRFAGYDPHDGDRLPYRSAPGAEALLDEAVRSFERRARRDSAETSAALDTVARRLESIEGRLHRQRDVEPQPDRTLDLVARRLESIEDQLEASRAAPAPAPATDDILEKVISRIETRIESIAAREESAPVREPVIPPVQVAPPVPLEPAAAPVPAVQIQSTPVITNAMRSSDLARIEAKLNRLLDREAQAAAMPAGLMNAGAVPVPMMQPAPTMEAQHAAGFYRQEPGLPPSRRPLQDAVAEINRRQADLDRGFARAGSNFQPPRVAPRMAPPATFPAAAAPDMHLDLRNSVSTLKSEIAELSSHIETLRREGAKSDMAHETMRNAMAASAQLPELDNLRRQITDLTGHLDRLRRESAKPENVAKIVSDAITASNIPNELDSLRRQIADVSSAIGKLAPRESLSSLEAAIRDLGAQVTQSRQEGARENILAPVENLITDMRRSLADFAPRSAVSAIEREIQAINRNIETMAKSGVDPDSFARACAQTAEIRNLLAAAVARPVPLENIEKQISSLARRVDLIATRGPTPVGVSAVNESVGEIRAAMQDAMPAPLLLALEERIEDLGRKIDAAASRPAPANAQLDDISQRLDKMHKALSSQVESAALQPVQAPPVKAELDIIAQRLDALHKALESQPVPADGAAPAATRGQMDAISQRLDSLQQTLAWQAERQPVAKVDTSLLEGMLQQIMERVNKPEPAAVMALPELDVFEKSLRDLASRVDNISQQSNFDGLAGLEERISSLASKLEQPELTGAATGEVERTLNHLVSQLEENRLSAIDAASNAARSAARDVLEEFARSGTTAAGSLDGAKDLIAREIDGLRSLQDASDRRTHATLGAVHETLEKVVDRLAMLEEEISETVPHTAPAMAAAQQESPVAADTFTSGPPPVFSRAGAAPDKNFDFDVADIRSTPATHADAPWEQRRAKSTEQAPAVQPESRAPESDQPDQREQPVSAAGGDDFLIEPGSGKRPPRSATMPAQVSAPPHQAVPAPSAPQTESEPPGRASASNFIAAARRAQQAAQAQADLEQAQQPPPKRGLKSLAPDNALAEARNRAKVAASVLSGSLKKSGQAESGEPHRVAPAGKAAKGLRMLSGRKVLFSLAGLVLVLGALTIIRQNMMRPPQPKAVASAPAQPAQTEPAKDNIEAAASLPALSPLSATVSAPATIPPTQFTSAPGKPAVAIPPQTKTPATAEPRTDRSPVSSIPTLAGGAPVAASNSLQFAAMSGDPRAQYELAVRMADGRSETRDPAAAASLLEKSAQSGLAPAQYRLGSLYEKGIGVSKDLKQARHWYEQASSAGNVKAMHNFAVLLAEGGDGKPDYATAASWFKRAAEFGVRDSQYNLAILYARGLGIEQSLTDAYVWLALAEGQGDTDAGTKRADVEKRLTPGQLAEARERVKHFRPQKAQAGANEVPAPAGGWRNDTPAAQAPASRPPVSAIQPQALSPTSAPRVLPGQRPPAVRPPKVSSL